MNVIASRLNVAASTQAPPTPATGHGAWRRHYFAVLGWAFTLFNSVRLAAALGSAPI